MKLNVSGILSLICGILGLLLACVLLGIFPAIAGLIFAILGLVQKNTKYGTSIAGLVCSVIAICISGIMFLIVGASSVDETDKETYQSNVAAESIVEENIIDCEIDECNIKYLSHEVKNDRTDNKCVVVYYEFANNSSDPKQFYLVATDKAFQNGVEIQSSIWEIEGYENNAYAEVKPGILLTVACSYVLRDNSEVELEIREVFNFENESIDSMIIELE